MANTVSRVLSDETLNRIIQIESAGNPSARAKTSSAGGLGQFLNGTWLGVVQKHKPKLFIGKSRDEVAAMRVGPDTAALQLEMLARFTEDNRAILGEGCADGDLYLAHFLGIADARKLFKAAPDELAEHVVTEGAVKANESILRHKKCHEVRAWAQASMEQRWVKAGKTDWVKKFAGQAVPSPLPPDIPKPVPTPVPPPAAPMSRETKRTLGTGGVIALIWAAATTSLQLHPFVIGGGVFLIVLAFIAVHILRNK